MNIQKGAEIIIRDWVRLRGRERLLIVSSSRYQAEMEALREAAGRVSSHVDLWMLDELSMYVGTYFNEREDAFDAYDAIIGAAEYSLITTKAVKRAVSRKKRFLSLPLSTNDGNSMLSYDFLRVDTAKSKIMAAAMLGYFQSASRIDIKTALGTDLHLSIRGRRAGFFNGCCRDGRGLSSASVEVYVPILEDRAEGTFVLDGSMGYIGIVESPVEIHLRGGRITEIENNASGRKLKEYIRRFQDPRMFIASEFGIGLNTYSRCRGCCYIEDESAYGTFHIGFGRNIALGGVQDAVGHFDLVAHNADIYVDNQMIMEQGRIMILEPHIY
ncbi:MAG: peptidase, partial [Eubacterium sp.]|nr:peptidase [Eubacterium sp.]